MHSDAFAERSNVGIGKVVELTPKRAEDASAFLVKGFGCALHRDTTDAEPPRNPLLREQHGIELVTNQEAVAEGASVRLDAGQISDEVLEIVDRLRELLIAYRIQRLCRTNAASLPIETTNSQFLDDWTSKNGRAARNQQN